MKMIKILNNLILTVILLFISNTVLAIDCSVLKPAPPTDIDETFSGSISGEVDGLFAKIAGVKADVNGTYRKVVKVVIDKFPESDRLKQYMWERVLYLQCEVLDTADDISTKEKLNLVSSLYSKFGSPAPALKKITYSNVEFSEIGEMMTHWIKIGKSELPRVRINNSQCRILVWLTNVAAYGNRPFVTKMAPTDSHLLAEPYKPFDHTFKYASTNLIMDAFKSTQISSEEEAKELKKYFSDREKEHIEVQLVFRKHWEDSSSCQAKYSIEYVPNA